MSRLAGKLQLGPLVVTITVEGRSRYRVVGLDAPSPDFPNKPEAERHLHRELASVPANAAGHTPTIEEQSRPASGRAQRHKQAHYDEF